MHDGFVRQSKRALTLLNNSLRSEDDIRRPNWFVRHNGTEIFLRTNRGVEMFVGDVSFSGVDFEATVYVTRATAVSGARKNRRNPIGFVFSYQVSAIVFLCV